MYARINYPDIKVFTVSNEFASGYLVWTYAATTTTPQTTYSDKALTIPNTNPVILDSSGEATIFTGKAVKLVITIPGGDPSSPLKVFDNIGEMQANFVTGLGITPSTNNYVVTTSPAVTSLPNNFQLIMTPDETNVDTIGVVVPAGTNTGPDDLTASGPYTGTTTGPIFTMEIDSTGPPTVALVATASLVAGTIATGNHYFKYTFVTAAGESMPSPISLVYAAPASKKVDLTGIAVSANADVTARNIYMTEAAGTTYYKAGTIAGNIVTILTVDIADGPLAGADPIPTEDTSELADTFKWKKDAGGIGLEGAGVEITALGTPQILMEGFAVTFAISSGHVLADSWTCQVTKPASLNLDGLGNFIIYKNKNKVAVPLDGGDMLYGYPAQLIINDVPNQWLLTNPATPVFVSPSVSAIRYRLNKTGAYTILDSDQGKEISCSGTFTVTLLPAPQFANHFIYFKNVGTGLITIDAGDNGLGVDYIIRGNGTRYYTLGPGGTAQLQTNGVDWHVMTTVGGWNLNATIDLTADATGTFTDLIPGLRYRLDFEVTPSGLSNPHIRFSGAVANYQSNLLSWTGVTPSNADSTTFIYVAASADSAAFLTGSVEFSSCYGHDHLVEAVGSSQWIGPTGYCGGVIRGRYEGAVPLTSVTLDVNGGAGTMTGRLWLYSMS